MNKFTILDDVFEKSNISNDIKNFDPKNNIRKTFSKLFSGFLMTKVSSKDIYSIYKARVDCMTCDDYKYIVVIVKNDNNNIGDVVPLSLLNWDVFQTRRTNSEIEFKNFGMISQGYLIKRDNILEERITKFMELEDKTLYRSENLPIKIEVVHIKKDDIFSDKGTLIAVLELYQTIIILE